MTEILNSISKGIEGLSGTALTFAGVISASGLSAGSMRGRRNSLSRRSWPDPT